MVPDGGKEGEFPFGVELFHSYPIFLIQRRFLKCEYRFVLSRVIETEPFALLRLNHGVVQELNHGKVLKGEQVLLVGLVLLRAVVVDVGQEHRVPTYSSSFRGSCQYSAWTRWSCTKES